MTFGCILLWLVLGPAAFLLAREMSGDEDFQKHFLFKKITVPDIEIPIKPKAPSFFKVCIEYAKAAHDKVCPAVKFQ